MTDPKTLTGVGSLQPKSWREKVAAKVAVNMNPWKPRGKGMMSKEETTGRMNELLLWAFHDGPVPNWLNLEAFGKDGKTTVQSDGLPPDRNRGPDPRRNTTGRADIDTRPSRPADPNEITF